MHVNFVGNGSGFIQSRSYYSGTLCRETNGKHELSVITVALRQDSKQVLLNTDVQQHNLYTSFRVLVRIGHKIKL